MSWEAMTFTEARSQSGPRAHRRNSVDLQPKSLRAWWHYGSGTVCDKARSQNDPGWISECDPSEPEFRHPQLEGDTHGRWPSGGSCDDLLHCKCVRGPVSGLKATVGHILKGFSPSRTTGKCSSGTVTARHLQDTPARLWCLIF